MRRLAGAFAVAAAALLAGCVYPSSTVCGDGRICPAGSSCDVENHRCVDRAEEEACLGLGEGASCMLGVVPGKCRLNACRPPFCGDGMRTGTEQCDKADLDGKTCADLRFYGQTTGLGCNDDCTFDTKGCVGMCGDGKIDTGSAEVCDGSDVGGLQCADVGFDHGLLACSAACQQDLSGCESFGWREARVSVPSVTAVWESGPDDVFTAAAVGTGGSLGHWDGTRWTQTSTPQAMFAVWGSGPNDVFAVGGSGAVLHWNGTAWSAMALGEKVKGPALTATYRGVWGTGPKDVFVVGGLRKVLRWDGKVWSDLSGGLEESSGFLAVWGRASDDVFAVGDEIQHWNGTAWSKVYQPDPGAELSLYGVGGAGADVFAVGGITGFGGLVVHGDGRSWSTTMLGLGLFGVWGRGPRDVFAVGGNVDADNNPVGQAWHWNGRHWSSVWVGGPDTPSGVGGSAEEICVAGLPSAILRGSGTHWVRSDLGKTANASQSFPYDAWGNDADSVFMLPRFGGGAVAHWDGEAWGGQFSGAPAGVLTAGWGTSVDDFFVADSAGLSHWTGREWERSLYAKAITSIWGSGPRDAIALEHPDASSTNVLRWDGTSWSRVASSPRVFNRAWGSGANDVFLVGDGIAHWNGALELMDAGVTTTFTSVWSSGPGDVYAVGAQGTIVHWDGARWQTMAAGTTTNLEVVRGSGRGDVFAAGGKVLLHLRSGAWERIAIPGDYGAIHGLWVTPERVFAFGDDGELRLERPSVTCVGPERACGDGWDNDCDGLADAADLNCQK